MDIAKVLAELRTQLRHLDLAIENLERLQEVGEARHSHPLAAAANDRRPVPHRGRSSASDGPKRE